jgi:hypothetical protein
LRGEIDFKGRKHLFEAKLVHVSGEIAGCAFVSRQLEFVRAFQDYFELELSALRLNRMNPEHLKKEPDGEPRFFHGNDCELFFVETPQSGGGWKLARFHLSFLGNYFEGELGKSVRYGYVIEPEDKDKPSHAASDLIRFTNAPPEMMAAAARFVENVRELTADQRAALLKMLKG